jgi:hypothetical protein
MKKDGPLDFFNLPLLDVDRAPARGKNVDRRAVDDIRPGNALSIVLSSCRFVLWSGLFSA